MNMRRAKPTLRIQFLGLCMLAGLGALLLRLIRPLELRLKKTRGQAKISILDLGLRASWLEETVPLDPASLEKSPHLADLAGHLAESAVGAFLAGLHHLDLAHFPARPTEPQGGLRARWTSEPSSRRVTTTRRSDCCDHAR